MNWEALVVGINRYIEDDISDLTQAAADAEAIAQLLEKYTTIQSVKRLPEEEREGQRHVAAEPHPTQITTTKKLRKAIISSLHLESNNPSPDTILFYFSGHGFRDKKQGYLCTSDFNPNQNRWGIPLSWLVRQLHKSPIKRQIIWLDCCHAGELLNCSELTSENSEYTRCIITSSRDHEVGVEDLKNGHGLLTAALLNALDPTNPENHPNGFVLSHDLEPLILEKFKQDKVEHHPQFFNSETAIILTQAQPQEYTKICPYRDLKYFTEQPEDAEFYYGRETVIGQLIEKVEKNNFLAVLGTSGSGKSSLIRAGLLYQLKQGQKIPGSNNWKYLGKLKPREEPFNQLMQTLGYANGKQVVIFAIFFLVQSKLYRLGSLLLRDYLGDNLTLKGIINRTPKERVILIIDQFEECFTMCECIEQRQRFLDTLIEALEEKTNKLCLIIGMRIDFLSNLLESRPAFAAYLAGNNKQVWVTPLQQNELEQAIIKPAKKAGLQVEPGLAVTISNELLNVPRNLPLLQYVMTKIYQQAEQSNEPRYLTRKMYESLRNIKEILKERANDFFNKLQSKNEKLIARKIFLELTQLDQGRYTHRRVRQQSLINRYHSQELVENVVNKLEEAGLITKELKETGKIIEVAHESLICEWEILHEWVRENKVFLKLRNEIELAAKSWRHHSLLTSSTSDYLWQGNKLYSAQYYLNQYIKLGYISEDAEEFIQKSIEADDKKKQRDQRTIKRLKDLDKKNKIALKNEQAAKQQSEIALENEQAAKRKADISLKNEQAAKHQAEDALKNEQAAKQQAEIALENEQAAKQKAEIALENEQDAKEEAEIALKNEQAAKRQAKTRMWIAIIAAVGVFILGGAALRSEQKAELREKVADIRRLVYINPFEALVRAIAATHSSQDIFIFRKNKVLPTVQGSLRESIQLASQEEVLVGHEGAILSVAVPSQNQDEKLIATAGNDSKVWIWKRNDYPLVRAHDTQQTSISTITFAHNGDVITGGIDGSIKVWEINNNKLSRKKEYNHQSSILALVTHPKNDYIVSSDTDGTVKLWDLQAGKSEEISLGHEGAVHTLTFSVDGEYLVSGGEDGKVKRWNQKTKQSEDIPLKPKGVIQSVAISSDGTYIASGNEVGEITIWNQETGKLTTLPTHSGSVNTLSFSSDNQYLVSGGEDKVVRVWNLENSELEKEFRGHGKTINAVIFSPDNQYIYSGSDDTYLRLWSLDINPQFSNWWTHDNRVTAVSASENDHIVFGSEDGKVFIWDKNEGEAKELQQSQDSKVNAVAISQDGKLIVSGRQDGKLIVTGRQKSALTKWENAPISSVAMTPDGKWIVSSSENGKVRLWTFENNQIKLNKILSSQDEEQNAIQSVAISENGNLIAFGNEQGKIKLWNQTTEEIKLLEGHKGAVNAVTFSSDGKYLISAGKDKTVRVWDTKEKQQIGEELKHRQGVNSVVIISSSADQLLLASGTEEGTLNLWMWNMEKGKHIAQLVQEYKGAINALAIHPDGKEIISIAGNEVRTWQAGTWEKWLETACKLWRGEELQFINKEPDIYKDAKSTCTQYWEKPS